VNTSSSKRGSIVITVRVKYLLQLREITGKNEEEIRLRSRSTVEDLLRTLVTAYGERAREYLFNPEGEVRRNLQLLINGRTLEKHEELHGHMLSEHDVLTILPAATGG